MSDSTYENILGGHTYPFSIDVPAKNLAVPLESKLPPIDIGPDRIIKSTNNFLIVSGKKWYGGIDWEKDKGVDKNKTDYLRFYIIPVTDENHTGDQVKVERLLESAAKEHHIPTELRLVRDQQGDTHMCLCVRFDFSQRNWNEYIRANQAEDPVNVASDTVPHIEFLQRLFDRGQTRYPIQAKNK